MQQRISADANANADSTADDDDRGGISASVKINRSTRK